MTGQDLRQRRGPVRHGNPQRLRAQQVRVVPLDGRADHQTRQTGAYSTSVLGMQGHPLPAQAPQRWVDYMRCPVVGA